jgi:Rha family phage regulatory protein
MGKLVLNQEYGLYERDGKPCCTSLQVAETFEKRHDHVMRDIETKILGVAPEDFTIPNFGETKIKDLSGRINKCYIMTRDGFALVAMGFTGKKAMQFKVDYIRRFDNMETFITSLYGAKMEYPDFTDAVMLSHEEPKHYHFSNECDMINRIVVGVPAKKNSQGERTESWRKHQTISHGRADSGYPAPSNGRHRLAWFYSQLRREEENLVSDLRETQDATACGVRSRGRFWVGCWGRRRRAIWKTDYRQSIESTKKKRSECGKKQNHP